MTRNESDGVFFAAYDGEIETIEKLRIAKSILNKAFTIVNAYELQKAEPVSFGNHQYFF